MTIASELSHVVYVTDGVTTTFSVPFRFLAASHLRVTHTDAMSVATVFSLDTHYSITGANETAGGAVVLASAPGAGGKLAIVRQVPLTQETAYPKNDPFPEAAHERALDKLTMIAQQLDEGLSRAVKLPVSDPRTPEEFTEEFFQAAADARAAATEAASQAQDRWNDINGKFTVSTDPPSGGKDGDIWFQVI